MVTPIHHAVGDAAAIVVFRYWHDVRQSACADRRQRR
jgi:hypothetical protein